MRRVLNKSVFRLTYHSTSIETPWCVSLPRNPWVSDYSFQPPRICRDCSICRTLNILSGQRSQAGCVLPASHSHSHTNPAVPSSFVEYMGSNGSLPYAYPTRSAPDSSSRIPVCKRLNLEAKSAEQSGRFESWSPDRRSPSPVSFKRSPLLRNRCAKLLFNILQLSFHCERPKLL